MSSSKILDIHHSIIHVNHVNETVLKYKLQNGTKVPVILSGKLTGKMGLISITKIGSLNKWPMKLKSVLMRMVYTNRHELEGIIKEFGNKPWLPESEGDLKI